MDRKVAFITGASSGIGKALAVELARRGYVLGLTARREKELAEVAQAVGAAGSEALVKSADVTDRAAVEAAAAAVEERFGRIDLLVASAGISAAPKRGNYFDVDAVSATIGVNLLGVVHAIGAVLPGMLERGSGHVAAISSLAAYRGSPKLPGYSASKAGVNALLESRRIDIFRRGVDVTIVNPGFVETPMVAKNKSTPFLVSAERAAEIIATGLARRKRVIEFPLPLVAIVRGSKALLPDWLHERLLARKAPRPASPTIGPAPEA